jgi:hypothetical protein
VHLAPGWQEVHTAVVDPGQTTPFRKSYCSYCCSRELSLPHPQQSKFRRGTELFATPLRHPLLQHYMVAGCWLLLVVAGCYMVYNMVAVELGVMSVDNQQPPDSACHRLTLPAICQWSHPGAGLCWLMLPLQLNCYCIGWHRIRRSQAHWKPRKPVTLVLPAPVCSLLLTVLAEYLGHTPAVQHQMSQ